MAKQNWEDRAIVKQFLLSSLLWLDKDISQELYDTVCFQMPSVNFNIPHSLAVTFCLLFAPQNTQPITVQNSKKLSLRSNRY